MSTPRDMTRGQVTCHTGSSFRPDLRRDEEAGLRHVEDGVSRHESPSVTLCTMSRVTRYVDSLWEE